MHRILAIDPGSYESAYVLIEDNIKSKGIVSNHIILALIYELKYDTLAIEMIASYGMPVGSSVFDTCVWIGRFYERSKCNDKQFIYRKDVKMYLCNSMRAKDSNIRQALIDKYGSPGTKKDPNLFYNDSTIKISKDIWSALAVATYVLKK